jgi:predicted acyl esterase
LFIKCLSPRAQEADFVVRLCDVSPSGKSLNVCDGVKRLKFIDTHTDTHPYTEGGVFRVEVDIYPTAVRFAKGHRVRVHVASAGFIRWERNVNAYGYPSFIPVRFEVVHGVQTHTHTDTQTGGEMEGSAVYLPLVAEKDLVRSCVKGSC